MIKTCVVCNAEYKIPKSRWNFQKIKVPFCSKECKKSKVYIEKRDLYLINIRGYPLGYQSKIIYDSRFIAKEIVCPCCGVIFNSMYDTQTYCSKNCAVTSPERNEKISNAWKTTVDVTNVRDKRKNTCLNKYGVENPQQLERVREKTQQTNLQKYGVENPFQNKELVKRGVLKKYGVENYFQRSELMKDHYVDVLGVDNPQKDQNIKNKTLKTVKEKYGDLIGSVPAEQTFKTNLKKYGNKHFFGSEQGKMSFKNLKENYGWSDEEIEKFRKIKRESSVCIGRASKQSLEYFIPLYKKLRLKGIKRDEIFLGLGRNIEYCINGYYYDFCIPKKQLIIEFHGEFFHPNPNKLSESGWNNWRQLFTNRSASEQYQIDQTKNDIAHNHGYTLIELWSSNTKEHNWNIIKTAFATKGIQL